MIQRMPTPVVVDNRIIQDAKPHVWRLPLPESVSAWCEYPEAGRFCGKRATHYTEYYRPAREDDLVSHRAEFRQEANCEKHSHERHKGWLDFHFKSMCDAQDSIPAAAERIAFYERMIATAKEMTDQEWLRSRERKSTKDRNTMIEWWESRIEVIRANGDKRLKRIAEKEEFYRLMMDESALHA